MAYVSVLIISVDCNGNDNHATEQKKRPEEKISGILIE